MAAHRSIVRAGGPVCPAPIPRARREPVWALGRGGCRLAEAGLFAGRGDGDQAGVFAALAWQTCCWRTSMRRSRGSRRTRGGRRAVSGRRLRISDAGMLGPRVRQGHGPTISWLGAIQAVRGTVAPDASSEWKVPSSRSLRDHSNGDGLTCHQLPACKLHAMMSRRRSADHPSSRRSARGQCRHRRVSTARHLQ